ncbi:TIM barrel protein [Halalkalibacter flavus]|uniref:TIM barrel protein n=1 Tax=Halalkalibacter flavus TaxID=3090668 RepID=UPI002FC83AA1
MKYLLGITNKFIDFDQEPKEWINSWKEVNRDNLIDGFEIYMNMKDEKENEYYLALVEELIKEDWIVQVHAPDIDKCLNDRMITYLVKLASSLNNPLKVNVHPVSSTISMEHNKKLTIEAANQLEAAIKGKNICFVVENLNKVQNPFRLYKDDFQEIFHKNTKIGFCWDVGHEVDDEICTYSLPEIFEENLQSIHLHDVNELSDHQPFYYDNTNLGKLTDYLESINYKREIVFEIAYDYLEGNSLRKKQIEYLRQVEKFQGHRGQVPRPTY